MNIHERREAVQQNADQLYLDMLKAMSLPIATLAEPVMAPAMEAARSGVYTRGTLVALRRFESDIDRYPFPVTAILKSVALFAAAHITLAALGGPGAFPSEGDTEDFVHERLTDVQEALRSARGHLLTYLENAEA